MNHIGEDIVCDRPGLLLEEKLANEAVNFLTSTDQAKSLPKKMQ